jgi:hypothetical protein
MGALVYLPSPYCLPLAPFQVGVVVDVRVHLHGLNASTDLVPVHGEAVQVLVPVKTPMGHSSSSMMSTLGALGAAMAAVAVAVAAAAVAAVEGAVAAVTAMVA